MNFNTFGDLDAVASGNRRLAPWGIYKVKFMGAKKDSIQGKADTSKTYDILKIRFEGEDGYYEESVFYPSDDQFFERRTFTNRDGHEYQMASNWERVQTMIAQLGTVLNKEGFEKFQAASRKGTFKSFDDVVKGFIKIMEPAVGKETNLKLVGHTDKQGNVNAQLPKFVAVNKEGKLFVSDNFVGDKLYFSAYEERQKANMVNAKPSPMPDVLDVDKTDSKDDLDGIDFSDL